MIYRKLLPILVFAAGICIATSSAQAAAPVEIVSAEFGLFHTSNPSELVFEPALVVPHREGQRYGWVIELRTTRRSLSVREEYLLSPPVKDTKTADPSSEGMEIVLPRRNQVSQRQLVPVGGKIYGEWSVGPSEPAGHRYLQVVIEGQVAASFEYDVK